ncbi:MAG: type IV secretion system protein VirB10 [Acidiphilium sp.]|nr:type IV secretion system protein VirB10 [Acidiphilium sp.]
MVTDDDKRPYGPVSGGSPVEHDVSPVGGTGSRFSVAQKVGGLLAIGVLALGAVALTHWPSHHVKLTKTASVTPGGGLQFHSTVQTTPAPVKPAALPLPSRTRSPFASPFVHQQSPAMKALKAPIFAYTGGAPAASSSAPAAAGASSATPASAVRSASAFSNEMHASRFDHVDARLIAHPNFTIAAGTIIPCTLQTAIDSGLPGFVKCVLPTSVRSMTGAVTLLDRGTQVLGQIRQGLVQGQDRLFILWTRAVTPQNVVVNLGSPAAGPLGRSGVSGAVDNHFFQRFGAAIMLTLIGGSLEAGANAAQSGSGNTYFQSLNTNTNQIANTALQSTIDIPPTLRKNQGDNVSIFVARDLNFSHVYKLSLVNP